MKAVYKKMIKYKGVYHLANTPFSISSEDIQELLSIGVEIIEEKLDKRKTTKKELKDGDNSATDNA